MRRHSISAKLAWHENGDGGEGTNVPSITAIIGVAGLFCKLFRSLLFSMPQ